MLLRKFILSSCTPPTPLMERAFAATMQRVPYEQACYVRGRDRNGAELGLTSSDSMGKRAACGGDTHASRDGSEFHPDVGISIPGKIEKYCEFVALIETERRAFEKIIFPISFHE